VFRSMQSIELFVAFRAAASFAVLHAVINVFPLLPLDGGRAALPWGNPDVRRFVMQIAQFGSLGLMVFFLLLSITRLTGRCPEAFLSFCAAAGCRIPALSASGSPLGRRALRPHTGPERAGLAPLALVDDHLNDGRVRLERVDELARRVELADQVAAAPRRVQAAIVVHP